jgi:hypothetical protein
LLSSPAPVVNGRLTYRFSDHDEVFEAGDAFYLPPGHIPTDVLGKLGFIDVAQSHEVGRTSMRLMLSSTLAATSRRKAVSKSVHAATHRRPHTPVRPQRLAPPTAARPPDQRPAVAADLMKASPSAIQATTVSQVGGMIDRPHASRRVSGR